MLAKIIIFIFTLLLSCNVRVNAQKEKTLSLADNTNAIVQQYTSERSVNLLLYNGAEYAHSYPRTTGYPFFLTDTFQRSTIVYDGVLYENVPLAYDELNNQVVIKNKDSFLIQLVPEKVDSFVFKNHFFLSLIAGSLPKSAAVSPGVYEVYQYGDSVSVLIHHQKIIVHAENAADMDRFKGIDDYFVRLHGTYYPVNNNNSLLSVFSNRSNEMKNYLRQQHLNVKKHGEGILMAAGYYAQLKN